MNQEQEWIKLQDGQAESPIIRMDHIAIVSRQAIKIRRFLGEIGVIKTWEGIVPAIDVTCEYFPFPNIDIEIVTPRSDRSIVANHYNNYPNFPLHHLAFEVTSLKEGIKYFKSKGYRLINGNIYDAPKLHHQVVFLSPYQTGGLLIELVAESLKPEQKNEK